MINLEWKLFAKFFAAGKPKGQPRPRAFVRGKHAAVYDASTAEGWKSLIAMAAKGYIPPTPIDGPVRLDALFWMPRPKRLMRKNDPAGPVVHASKPDRDNLDKAVLDCLTAIGMFADDAQVCSGTIEKFYHTKDGKPGALITIWTL